PRWPAFLTRRGDFYSGGNPGFPRWPAFLTRRGDLAGGAGLTQPGKAGLTRDAPNSLRFATTGFAAGSGTSYETARGFFAGSGTSRGTRELDSAPASLRCSSNRGGSASRDRGGSRSR